jgi:serine/threonine protein kinase
VTEYATGDLYNLMTDHFGTAAYWKSMRLYAAEVLLGLEWMHQRGVIYRDLKPENLLLSPDGHMVLSDLGMSTRLRNGERASRVCGTVQYMSPEMLTQQEYGFMSDLWSYGVLLHEMTTGFTPLDIRGDKPSDTEEERSTGANNVERIVAEIRKLTSYGDFLRTPSAGTLPAPLRSDSGGAPQLTWKFC